MKDGFLFFDGAFGTYYSNFKGGGAPCELANIYDEDTVLRIHKEYIAAGANALKTNTFGANSALGVDRDVVFEVIKKGYEIAVRAADGKAKVFADIGYIDGGEGQDAAGEYIDIAEAFLKLGARFFLFETLAELEPVLPAVNYIKEKAPDAFVVVSFAVSQDGYTDRGHYYKTLLGQALEQKGIDMAGLNCVCGPSHMFRLLKDFDMAGKSVLAMPNSGYPSRQNGRTVFYDNAGYFAERLVEIYTLGVRGLGGCCGTTPEHIRCSVDRIFRQGAVFSGESVHKEEKGAGVFRGNAFKERLLAGEKVVAVEIDPPFDNDSSFIVEAAKAAKAAGADIVTIADSPLARARADSIVISAKIRREVGIEVLPHITCRDRNHIAIKAALIGASIEGICNILAVTGDPVPATQRGEQKGVFSFNSFNLISFVNSLNAEIFKNSPFFIGGALNVNSANFDAELERARKKVERGAGMMLTQPVFSDEAVGNLKRAAEALDCRILAGILPVAGYKNALYLNNEVSGISIPEDFINSLQGKDRQEAEKISFDFSMGIVEKVYGLCHGFYLIAPLKRIESVARLVKAIKEKDRG